MSKRVPAIEYIRGLAMLGVVGIHTGAYSLTNPDVNIHLFALLEIFTRFSVPIFFFVSAFGLFCQYKAEAPLDYRNYFRRRYRTVVIPYVIWSLLYMLHQTLLSGDKLFWKPPYIFEYFFFGLASYQLYFLVILIWFYLLMPLWRRIMPWLLKAPVKNLAILLVLQIIFNYYSCFLLEADSDNYFIRLALQYRLSYLPLHYFFIFLLGAVCAQRLKEFLAILTQHRTAVKAFFAATLAGMLGAYYWLLLGEGYTPEQAVNTVQQLNPIGVLYTLAATLFLVERFNRQPPSGGSAWLLDGLSCYSYPVYLVHPLVMYYLTDFLAGRGFDVTVPVVLFFYTATIVISLSFGWVLGKTTRFLPLVGLLLGGSSPRSPKVNSAEGS